MIPGESLVLLDTNILVHLIRRNAIGRRVESDHRLTERPERPLVSFVTLGELRALALKLNWGTKRTRQLDDLLDQLVVVNINQGDILDHYATLDHHTEKVAQPARRMGKNDLWIAATASALSAVLVTTDGDFDHLAPIFFHRVKVDATTGESDWL